MAEPSEKPDLTICVKCQHHHGIGPIWYDQRCFHPEAALPPELDVVTGRTVFNGGANEGPSPYCRDVNRTGHCKLYEGAGFIRRLICKGKAVMEPADA